MEPTTSDQFQRLVDCLTEQKDVYLRIVDVLGSEKTYLVLADIKSLVENNKLKEVLLSKSRALEKIRQVRTGELLKLMKLEVKEMSVSELIPLLPKEQARLLIESQVGLMSSLQNIRTLNSQNEKLVANAKNVIDSGLKSLKGEAPTNQVYKNKGQIEQGKSPGKIVSREV